MCHMRRRIHVSASVLSNTVCHMRRRRIHVSYEEEDTRVSFSPIQHQSAAQSAARPSPVLRVLFFVSTNPPRTTILHSRPYTNHEGEEDTYMCTLDPIPTTILEQAPSRATAQESVGGYGRLWEAIPQPTACGLCAHLVVCALANTWLCVSTAQLAHTALHSLHTQHCTACTHSTAQLAHTALHSLQTALHTCRQAERLVAGKESISSVHRVWCSVHSEVRQRV
jgi:hypothetical protein